VAGNLQRWIASRFPDHDRRSGTPLLRFITLTLKSSQQPLAKQIDRLYRSWRSLRCRKAIKPFLLGGLAFTEITRNADTGLWHPHLHVIVEGGYIDRDVIRREWHAITKDSYIVDICAIYSPRDVAGYVAKYAGKAIGPRVWRDPAAFADAIAALAGRRLFATFGIWKALRLSAAPDDTTDWVVVAPLSSVIARAAAGDLDACAILRYLRRSPANVTDYTETGPSP